MDSMMNESGGLKKAVMNVVDSENLGGKRES